jgi:hypothetical protein
LFAKTPTNSQQRERENCSVVVYCNKEVKYTVSVVPVQKKNGYGLSVLNIIQVRFQVLTAATMKLTVFWDVAPGDLVDATDVSEMLASSIIRMMKAGSTSETSVNYKTTRRNIPKHSHLEISIQLAPTVRKLLLADNVLGRHLERLQRLFSVQITVTSYFTLKVQCVHKVPSGF